MASWHLKQTEDDGIFVKVNGARLKTENGDLADRVLKVESSSVRAKAGKTAARCDSTVVVSKFNLLIFIPAKFLVYTFFFFIRTSKFCRGSMFF